ncbi:hypothetical protein [Microbacterium aurum]
MATMVVLTGCIGTVTASPPASVPSSTDVAADPDDLRDGAILDLSTGAPLDGEAYCERLDGSRLRDAVNRHISDPLAGEFTLDSSYREGYYTAYEASCVFEAVGETFDIGSCIRDTSGVEVTIWDFQWKPGVNEVWSFTDPVAVDRVPVNGSGEFLAAEIAAEESPYADGAFQLTEEGWIYRHFAGASLTAPYTEQVLVEIRGQVGAQAGGISGDTVCAGTYNLFRDVMAEVLAMPLG